MILHIDMDAFYASVEQLDNPWLKGKCVIVGGTSGRGVVSAASYEARRFGIRSAMPIFQAREKCPEAVFVAPRMARYKEVSRQVMAILRRFSPLVEVVSIDEAYLDIAGCGKLYGDARAMAAAIKAEIQASLRLTCSVGGAPLRFLAKIASDMDKPDGLTIIEAEAVASFIETLAVQKVPGVGRKTFGLLERMGIRTLGDVQKFPQEILLQRLGKFGLRLIELSAGRDRETVMPAAAPKSVSSERTLAADTRDKHLLGKHLLQQSAEVARQLRKAGLRARTITLKIKHADFTQHTRSKTIDRPTRSSETIYRHALGLLENYRSTRKIRLIGVGASGLTPDDAPMQMELFGSVGEADTTWETVDKTVEQITRKFGPDAVKRAIFSEDTEP